MDFIYVTCQHGHRLKAKSDLRGRTLPCPACHSEVSIPIQVDTLSDTGVMRILGDTAPLPPVPEPIRARLRPCPRCATQIRNELTVCSACNCYIGHSPDYMKQLR